MTGEEAIEYLKKADVTVYQEPKTRTAEALEMAIEALQEQKPKYPCELCKWHLQEDDTACWGCNAKPIEEGAEE